MKVLFIPLAGYGHLNASIGIAERVIARGHRAIFTFDSAWKGKASASSEGIEEVVFQHPTRKDDEKDNEANLTMMRQYMKRFPLADEPFESLRIAPVELEDEFARSFTDIDAEISEVIRQVAPDVIVLDTYSTSPAVYNCGIPWILMSSAAPLVCLPHRDLPPNRTGYPTVPPNHELWKAYKDLELERYGEIWDNFATELVERYGLPQLERGLTNHESPWLNIYAYPEEMDYLDIRPLPQKWRRFDHFIRSPRPSSSGLPVLEEFIKNDGGDSKKLIYVSMGSLGCVDTDLMERLIEMLAQSPHRFIFSLGSEAEKLRTKLGPRMFGAAFLPQMEILPHVDLVITHCGNNSLLESLFYSKPILAVPLFADQIGNAQRLFEIGLGERINAYKCSTKEFLDKVELLLANNKLHSRLETIGERLRNCNSTDKVVDAIEEVVSMKNSQ